MTSEKSPASSVSQRLTASFVGRLLKAEIHANNITNSDPASQKTVTVSITKTRQLMLFRKITAFANKSTDKIHQFHKFIT
jgi:hypothetical protein